MTTWSIRMCWSVARHGEPFAIANVDFIPFGEQFWPDRPRWWWDSAFAWSFTKFDGRCQGKERRVLKSRIHTSRSMKLRGSNHTYIHPSFSR